MYHRVVPTTTLPLPPHTSITAADNHHTVKVAQEYKHSTCTGGGCHQLQLALVVLFQSATSADRPLAHVVVSPSATCIDGAFSSRQWRKTCTCTQATCTVWWGYIYIYTVCCQ